MGTKESTSHLDNGESNDINLCMSKFNNAYIRPTGGLVNSLGQTAPQSLMASQVSDMSNLQDNSLHASNLMDSQKVERINKHSILKQHL